MRACCGLAHLVSATDQGRGKREIAGLGLQVPALVRFSGHPEVTEDGQLLYVFPSLQRTGRWQVRRAGSACTPPAAAMASLHVYSCDLTLVLREQHSIKAVTCPDGRICLMRVLIGNIQTHTFGQCMTRRLHARAEGAPSA